MDDKNNVIPLDSTIREKPPKEKDVDRSVAARWSPRLAQSFSPVPEYFLANYHRLRPREDAQGLTSTEAMVIVQLMSFKWDSRAPFPTIGKIAKRMGLAERTIREAVRRLEQLGYLQREFSPHGGPNRYHVEGLVRALEALMDADVVAADAKVAEGGR
jgi:DNA-binding MarR family transcriptional regulator